MVILKVEKPQAVTPEKSAEPVPVKLRPVRVEDDKNISEQIFHEAVLRAEKQDVQAVVAPKLSEPQPRTVKIKNEEVPEPEARSASKSQVEIYNLVAWERQSAQEKQVNLPEDNLIEPPQREVVTVSLEETSVAEVGEAPVPERLIELTDVVRIVHIQETFEVIFPADNESVPPVLIDASPEPIEFPIAATAEVIENIEVPTPVEELGVDDIAVEFPDKELPSDDIYIEAPIPEEDDAYVDEFLPDSGEGLQQIEAGYMSESLFAMLVDFAEIEQEGTGEFYISEAMEAEDVQSEIIVHKTAPYESFEAEFSPYLESIEPAQTETTKNVIEELSIALKEFQKLPKATTSEKKESIDQKLEELCVQLFEGLGIEYNAEIIEQFIQSITAQEPIFKMNIETDELSIDELNYIGTREYKSSVNASLLGSLTQFIKQKMQSHLALGRYAFHVLQA